MSVPVHASGTCSRNIELGSLLGFFYNTPDSTFPIFWSNLAGWQPLLPHNSSYLDIAEKQLAEAGMATSCPVANSIMQVMRNGEESRGETSLQSTGCNTSMRILFLAANPTSTTRLDLEEELRSLEQEIRGVRFRDSIKLIACHAVRPDDLIRSVREHQPNVIHFSGHGSKDGIVLQNDHGGYQVVGGSALTRFLKNRGVDLIVLNSCYSKSQVDNIQGAVRTVVGTTDTIGDEATRRFAIAFYRSLGEGLSVKEAFRDGGDTVALHGLEDVLHCNDDLELILVSR